MIDASRTAARVRFVARVPAVAAAALLLALVATRGDAMPVSEPREIELGEAVGMAITIHGRLARYGNEPHTYLGLLVDPGSRVLVDADVETLVVLDRQTLFRLQTDAESALDEQQGRELRVTGVLERSGAPGMPPLLAVRSWELAPPGER